MTVSIHIPLPVLVGTQYFVVKYRLQGSPTWIDISPKANTPFNLVGLSAGIYELFTQVAEGTSPEIVCDERIDKFTVTEDSSCLDYTVEFQTVENIITLHVTFTNPSPFPSTICAVEITYGISGQLATNQTITLYAPISSPISLPASANNYDISIRQIGCNGNVKECYGQTIMYESGPCDHIIFGSASLNLHPDATWWIVLNFTQSNPYSTPINVAYDQNNTVNTGVSDPGGSLNLAAGPSTTTITFQVFPNLNVVYTNGVPRLFYEGNITDRCRYSTKWAAYFDLN